MEKDKKLIDNDLKNSFPFLTYGIFNNEEYVGIIQNIKDNFLYIYLFNLIKSYELKKNFLLLGNKWWWESDRKIPIGIFFKKEFEIYKDCLRIFSLKKFKIIYSPVQQDLIVSKIKKQNKKIMISLKEKNNHDQ